MGSIVACGEANLGMLRLKGPGRSASRGRCVCGFLRHEDTLFPVIGVFEIFYLSQILSMCVLYVKQ